MQAWGSCKLRSPGRSPLHKAENKAAAAGGAARAAARAPVRQGDLTCSDQSVQSKRKKRPQLKVPSVLVTLARSMRITSVLSAV